MGDYVGYVIIGVIFGSLLLSSFLMLGMRKRKFLNVVGVELEFDTFFTKLSMAKASLYGVWQAKRVEVHANPDKKGSKGELVVKFEHHGNFTAFLRPTEELQYVRREALKKKREGEDIRPWRAKLTEEEQKVLDERRWANNAVDGEDGSKLFSITSTRSEMAAKYLDTAERKKAVEGIFRCGYIEIRLEPDGIVAVKQPYDDGDLLAQRMNKVLLWLKDLS